MFYRVSDRDLRPAIQCRSPAHARRVRIPPHSWQRTQNDDLGCAHRSLCCDPRGRTPRIQPVDLFGRPRSIRRSTVGTDSAADGAFYDACSRGTSLGESLGQIIPRHRKSASSVNTGTSISASPGATRENLNQVNQPQAGRSNPSDRDMGLGSAGMNSNESQSAIEARLAPELRSIDPAAPVNVIMKYNQFSADEALEYLHRQSGKKATALPLVNGELVTVRCATLRSLAAQSGVLYVSPDRPVKGALDTSVATVNGGSAQSLGLDGSGIGVAVIDSGVTDVPDLDNGSGSDSRSSYGGSSVFDAVYQQSFVPGDTSPSDSYGHGTHVTGILTSNGAKSIGDTYFRHFVGIASGVKLINLRVLDQNGNGYDSAFISAIQKAIQLKNQYNIRVINLSFGRPVYESAALDPLCEAVEQAWKAGIVVVVAAGNYGRLNSVGNNGYGTITAPGNDPYVITVVAMCRPGRRCSRDVQLERPDGVCALAMMGSTMKIRLPGLKTSISTNFVFILIGIALLSFGETVLIGLGGALVQSLWRPLQRPKPVQIFFNSTCLTVCTAAAFWASHSVPAMLGLKSPQ